MTGVVTGGGRMVVGWPEPCPLCGADDAAPLWPAPPTAVVRCRRCGLRYVSPRLGAHVESADYYVEQYLPEIAVHGAGAAGPIRDIERYVRPGRLLDVGCALGDHLVAARGRGWRVAGVELAPYAADHARTTHGLDVHCGTVHDLPAADGTFDAVLLAEVVEHLSDLRPTLARVAALLRPGGVVWLSTPNASGLAAAVLGAAWDRIEPVGHLCYFDAATLARLVRTAGLDVLAANAIDVDRASIAARARAAGRPVAPARLAAAGALRAAAVAAARAARKVGLARGADPAGGRWLAGETLVLVARR